MNDKYNIYLFKFCILITCSKKLIDFNDYKQKCSDNYRKTILMELFELEFKKYYARNKFVFEF